MFIRSTDSGTVPAQGRDECRTAKPHATQRRRSRIFAIYPRPCNGRHREIDVAIEKGFYRFSDGEAFPSILYSVAAAWAQQGDRGGRLQRALRRAHDWLYDPRNRAEAIAILQKYAKREPDPLAPIDDLYIAKDAIHSRDGAVGSDVDKVIAQMAENGAIPKGAIVSPDLYLLPKELGGLSR
jgi:hypothetical protein